MWGTRRFSCFTTCAYEKTFFRKYNYLWDLTAWPPFFKTTRVTSYLGRIYGVGLEWHFPFSFFMANLSLYISGTKLFPHKTDITLKTKLILTIPGRSFICDLTTISTAVTLLSVGWHDINKQRRRANQSFGIPEHTYYIIILANKQSLVYLTPKGLNAINEE